MPTKYIRKQGSTRGNWTEEDLIQAMRSVQEHRMGVNEASRYYNIPKTTLKRKLSKNCTIKGPFGPSSVLGIENEQKLVKHIKKLQSCGFSPTRDSVRTMAFKLAKQMNYKNSFNEQTQKAGYDWLQSFLTRNPSLAVRKSEGVSKNRALGMNKNVVQQYFDLLSSVLKDNDLIEKPGNIFNMDETGLQLNNRPGEVIAEKGSKSVNTITSGEKGETVTVVSCFSGEGSYLPPYCIFKGKNKKAEYGDGLPPGSAIVMNEKSAYINSDLFLDWLKTHFVPRKPPGKVLLILDGHSSHCNSVDMLEYSDENDVVLLSLPSHTSHYLQPLDRSFFKSLKSNYYSVCNTFMTNNPSRQINRLQFGKLLAEAWSKSATVENALSGFKRCGIVPLDMGAIPDYCFLTQPEENSHLDEFVVIDSQASRPKPTNNVVENLAVPGTSRSLENDRPTQSDQDNLTPTKALNKISPVPALKKKTTTRSVIASTPKVLNSIANINKIKKLKEEKVEKLKVKEDKKRKREAKQVLFQNKKKGSEKGVIYNDSSDGSDGWEENQCVGCLEDYLSTNSKEDWIKCSKCSRWYHENCSKFGNLCDFCGKIEKKNKRPLQIKKEKC